jgi:integrase
VGHADLVFASTTGTPVDYANVRREFKNLLAMAGLPPIRLHDLRHTCATLLMAQGVHARIVMEALGHGQISLTWTPIRTSAPNCRRRRRRRWTS